MSIYRHEHRGLALAGQFFGADLHLSGVDSSIGQEAPVTDQYLAVLNRYLDAFSGDRLKVCRLCQPDASQWLERNLSTGPAGAFGDPILYLVEGKATLDQLIAIKQTSKSLLGAGPEDEASLAALTSYFFAVAAALLHHRTVICSRSRSTVKPVLLDLAAVSGEPWATFLSDASDNPTE